MRMINYTGNFSRVPDEKHRNFKSPGQHRVDELWLAKGNNKNRPRISHSWMTAVAAFLVFASALLYANLKIAAIEKNVTKIDASVNKLEDNLSSHSHENLLDALQSGLIIAAKESADNSGGFDSSRAIDAVRSLNLRLPVDGVTLPKANNLYPGAARNYRNGLHEGVDLYSSYNRPVHASADGFVVWLDDDYTEYSKEFRNSLLSESKTAGNTPDDVLWLLKGRKVVISHGVRQGYRISTVYAHLNEISAGLKLGSVVKKGQVIGTVGNSGTSDGVKANKNGAHLHYEIRIDDRSGSYFLGEGLGPDKSKALLLQVFK